jgi:hypothetical protein
VAAASSKDGRPSRDPGATLPYLDVVYQVARHAAGDGQEPEDLVQETYLRAYAAFGSFRGGNIRACGGGVAPDVAEVVIAGLDELAALAARLPLA